eukprot:4529398-Ditylum_brightwellii.AAC.1
MWMHLAHSNQQRVDEHGNVVATHNAVPGAGHTIAHDCIKSAFGDMAKVPGMKLQYEAENVFHGSVQESYISRYCEHYFTATLHDNSVHKDAVVPDDLVHNYPLSVYNSRN